MISDKAATMVCLSLNDQLLQSRFQLFAAQPSQFLEHLWDVLVFLVASLQTGYINVTEIFITVGRFPAMISPGVQNYLLRKEIIKSL